MDNNLNEQQMEQPVAAAPAKKKKKKWPFFLVGGILLAAVITTVVLLIVLGGNKKEKKPDYTREVLEAEVYDDKAVFVLENGSIIQIKEEEISEAYITEDRKNILVIKEDDSAYITDAKLSKKDELEAKEFELYDDIYNEGFLYQAEDEETERTKLYRYTFADGKSIEIENYKRYTVSDDFDIYYEQESEDNTSYQMYRLAANSTKPTMIYQADKTIYFSMVSKDGEKVLFRFSTDEDKHMFKIYENGKVFDICSVNSYDYEYYTSEDMRYVFIQDIENNKFYIREKGKAVVAVDTQKDVEYGAVYTSEDFLPIHEGSTKGFYVETKTDEKQGFTYVTLKGKMTPIVLSDEYEEYTIHEGYVLAAKETDNGYTYAAAKLNGTSVGTFTAFAEDILGADAGEEGKNMFFVKEETNTSLYAYKLGSKSAKLVCDNVKNYRYTKISEDGKYLYYFTEGEFGFTSDAYTLKCYSFETGKSKTISEDVVISSVTSNLESGCLDQNNIIFSKKIKDSNNVYTGVVSLVRYNGSRAKVIYEDINDFEETEED